MGTHEQAAAAARDRLAAGSRRPWLGAGVIGLLLAAASVIWFPHLVLYLVGLGMAAIAAVLAVLTRTGAPHWTLAINGITGTVLVDGDRILASDESATFAVDATDG